jgi:signal transduction histidine kinase
VDLVASSEFVRSVRPPPTPLRTYVGVPILVGTSVRGVLELFSDEPRRRDDGLLSILVDLGTQLGRALERTEADAAHQHLDAQRVEFVARAAHELRTPVAALVMAVGVLADHDLPDPRDKELLRVVVDSTDHLERLVTRLLDLSTLERGTPELSMGPTDLRAAVDHVLALCPAPPDHTVTSHVRSGSLAVADELSLEQILTNLLANAYRHGGDHVRIDAWREGGRVDVAVSDDGPGVDPAIEPTLFEPFVRGAAGSHDGAGLGLAISHRLAQAMGGSLRYERLEGDGSRFVLDLSAVA